MIGDRLLIMQEHTERARELLHVLNSRLSSSSKLTLAVCGESGAGKSELAAEIHRLTEENGFSAAILQQDDYFVFPPRMNEKMRRRNIDQVGPYEVKLDCLDGTLRSYKRGETLLYKPLVLFEEDRIVTEELDVSDVDLLIVEGTYTGRLVFADIRVFIDRDYTETRADRLRRARETQDDFLENVLSREHRHITASRRDADWIVASDFGSIIPGTKPDRHPSSGGEIPQGGTL